MANLVLARKATAIVEEVFAVRLTKNSISKNTSNPNIVNLTSLVEELAAEDALGPNGEILALALGDEAAGQFIDRLIVDRLIQSPPPNYPQTPAHYFVACYSRSNSESARLPAVPSPAASSPASSPAPSPSQASADAAALHRVLLACRDLILNYFELLFSAEGLIPQLPAAERRGSLALLDSLDRRMGGVSSLSSFSGSGSGSSSSSSFDPDGVWERVPALPRELLEALLGSPRIATLNRNPPLAEDPDRLRELVILPLVGELCQRVASCSTLGEFSRPFEMMERILAVPAAAQALSSDPKHWLPNRQDPKMGRSVVFLPRASALRKGREVEAKSIAEDENWNVLGPFFSVSPLPDLARHVQLPSLVREPRVLVDQIQAAPTPAPDIVSELFPGSVPPRHPNPDGSYPAPVDELGPVGGSRWRLGVVRAHSALMAPSKLLTSSLVKLTKGFLKPPTRSRMVEWLAAAAQCGGAERLKMAQYINWARVPPNGFCFNLCTVLLELCRPFLDPRPDSPFWIRVDPDFVAMHGFGSLLSYDGDTRLSATTANVVAWEAAVRRRLLSTAASSQENTGLRVSGSSIGDKRDRPDTNSDVSSDEDELKERASRLPPGGNTHFICQCFFITAKALHVGLKPILERASEDARNLEQVEQQIQLISAEQNNRPNPQRQAHLNGLKWHAETLKAGQAVWSVAGASNVDMLGDLLSFYRLMATWLLHLATKTTSEDSILPTGSSISSPSSSSSPISSFSLPSSSSSVSSSSAAPAATDFITAAATAMLSPNAAPSAAFSCMPEYFLEDMCHTLIWMTRSGMLSAQSGLLAGRGAMPAAVASKCLEDLAIVFTALIANPKFIRSAYLRALLSDVISAWVPAAHRRYSSTASDDV
eukprot:CAMPEP_0175045900 /NCGR_PEP_ID=MMETSP0052_2-20121109/4715_1 /TAXON_ID=51329 ORGANISM="Polytomella parva, Strain SAG 63-3" /NCGR_SAMPLE_ID=MMETSP0052_2 /ASSEMBLY_ACC=CAM_ASM_000194 /LENGTH=880 /DNA_ID=CAMNT_0016309553 /DNA_START=21 /DNA_END=2660 /DNA_ORIENTATION=+